MILAGDIGGTKTALGIYSPETGNMALKVMATGGVCVFGRRNSTSHSASS